MIFNSNNRLETCNSATTCSHSYSAWDPPGTLSVSVLHDARKPSSTLIVTDSRVFDYNDDSIGIDNKYYVTGIRNSLKPDVQMRLSIT